MFGSTCYRFRHLIKPKTFSSSILKNEWMTFSKPQLGSQCKRFCHDSEDRSSNSNSNSRVVRLLGLPYSAKEPEIRHFFNGINVDSIVLGKDRLGRSSGTALVKLDSEEDLDKALQRDRDYIGDRYVEVFESSDADLERAMSMNLRVNQFSTGRANSGRQGMAENVIKMRGAPFNVTKSEIVQFFRPIDVLRIVIESDNTGRPSGFVFVQFNSKQDAEAAMEKNKEYIGNRWVDLFLQVDEPTSAPQHSD